MAPAAIRVGGLRQNCRGSFAEITAPTSTTQMLLSYGDITKIARTLHLAIIELEANQTLERVKAHTVSVVWYMGNDYF